MLYNLIVNSRTLLTPLLTTINTHITTHIHTPNMQKCFLNSNRNLWYAHFSLTNIFIPNKPVVLRQNLRNTLHSCITQRSYTDTPKQMNNCHFHYIQFNNTAKDIIYTPRHFEFEMNVIYTLRMLAYHFHRQTKLKNVLIQVLSLFDMMMNTKKNVQPF